MSDTRNYITSIPSDDSQTTHKLGQRVRLRELEEGAPQEEGVILTADKLEWGNSYTVEVDEQYREHADDGLRDISDDDVEEVLWSS